MTDDDHGCANCQPDPPHTEKNSLGEHTWIWEYQYVATGYFASSDDALADAEHTLHPSRIPDVRIVQVAWCVPGTHPCAGTP